jgi:hypothetical protein
MTLRELEASLNGPSTQARYERLKNLTSRGIIPVYGEKNPGTGRSRLFSDEAVTYCNVLEMMHEIGMRVEGRCAFIRTIAADAELIEALFALVQAKRDIS